jgi:hypothetical protein
MVISWPFYYELQVTSYTQVNRLNLTLLINVKE